MFRKRNTHNVYTLVMFDFVLSLNDFYYYYYFYGSNSHYHGGRPGHVSLETYNAHARALSYNVYIHASIIHNNIILVCVRVCVCARAKRKDNKYFPVKI